MRGFILTPTYRVRDGVPEVHLYGVLESGEPCLIIDDRVRPYFFLRAADRGAVERVAPELRLSETDLHMKLIDYVPSCRSEAGTGCGMAFATWE